MGGEQAAGVLATVHRDADKWTPEDQEKFKAPIRAKYDEEGHPYFATARLWDDGIIAPSEHAPRAGACLLRRAQRPDRGDAVRRLPDVREMAMFKSLLIANRGEIAVRIIRTARRMGLKTIAVYSDADANAYHVAEADEAYRIGPAPAAESYLRVEAILDACARSGAEAVHPGYGFLSENAGFAEACEKAGLVFVGPPASAIKAMGLKDAAKALMEKAGVPVVPGYHGDNQEGDFLAGQAETIGYPVLIKAVAGGGGKGMRRVDDPADFAKELKSAQREAGAAFSDERVLVEKFMSHGRATSKSRSLPIVTGRPYRSTERDCSPQRRHQKVIEEAPAPGMPDEIAESDGRSGGRGGEGHRLCGRGHGGVHRRRVRRARDPTGSGSWR